MSAGTREPTADPAAVYDALAPIYDQIDGARSIGLMAAERLEALLVARGFDPASVLDLGCGTGTLLSVLRGRHPGWRLAGVDVSAGMLAVAREKLGSDGVLWVRARLPGPLPFAGGFDAAGAFYDTLNHLPDLDALEATFRGVGALLRPGGLFAFDLNNAFGFETWWRYQVSFDVADHHVASELVYDKHTRTGRATIGLAKDGLERRFLLHQRCFSEAEAEGALFRAGFTLEVAAPWAPVRGDSPSKTWFVASKKQ
jgi:SAM-dependent methyltransferase